MRRDDTRKRTLTYDRDHILPFFQCKFQVIALLVYKIIKTRIGEKQEVKPPEPELPKMRRDFTVKELREYDGNGKDGRVLIAVNGTVYDVTKGKRFYGPGNEFFLGWFENSEIETFCRRTIRGIWRS